PLAQQQKARRGRFRRLPRDVAEQRTEPTAQQCVQERAGPGCIGGHGGAGARAMLAARTPPRRAPPPAPETWIVETPAGLVKTESSRQASSTNRSWLRRGPQFRPGLPMAPRASP